MDIFHIEAPPPVPPKDIKYSDAVSQRSRAMSDADAMSDAETQLHRALSNAMSERERTLRDLEGGSDPFADNLPPETIYMRLGR